MIRVRKRCNKQKAFAYKISNEFARSQKRHSSKYELRGAE